MQIFFAGAGKFGVGMEFGIDPRLRCERGHHAITHEAVVCAAARRFQVDVFARHFVGYLRRIACDLAHYETMFISDVSVGRWRCATRCVMVEMGRDVPHASSVRSAKGGEPRRSPRARREDEILLPSSRFAERGQGRKAQRESRIQIQNSDFSPAGRVTRQAMRSEEEPRCRE